MEILDLKVFDLFSFTTVMNQDKMYIGLMVLQSRKVDFEGFRKLMDSRTNSTLNNVDANEF